MKIKNLGLSIKKNRERLSLTQETLAELINVNPHYIYELERGLKTPSLSVLIAIAETFHVGIDALLHEESTKITGDNNELTAIIKNLTAEQQNNLAKILIKVLPHLKL